jgi:hypothetical protein
MMDAVMYIGGGIPPMVLPLQLGARLLDRRPLPPVDTKATFSCSVAAVQRAATTPPPPLLVCFG